LKRGVGSPIESLGAWQRPILQALREQLFGSYAKYVLLPLGGAGLMVYWKGFAGRPQRERQVIVRKVIGSLGAGANGRIEAIVALTPEEAAQIGAAS
jgi:hypothetical protein